jgi:para-nitrobenzyl esterase
MKKHIFFYIFFPIGFILLSAIIIFYMDLANGPLIFFILELITLISFLVSSILLINKKIRIRLIPWASFIVLSTIFLLLSYPRKYIKDATDSNTKTEVLKLKNGSVQGLLTKDDLVEVYAGIPYAKAPIGDLRWKEPVPIDDFDGVLDCTKFKSKSMQPEGNQIVSSLADMVAEKGWHPNFIMQEEEYCSEDSLYLNIWRPKKIDKKLPILVYIHGGSLTTGSPSFDDYNGETFAKNNVIMITIAYRLGVFGYFAHPDLISESKNHTTGNYGLLDQIEALRWVNENADFFGGDKNNITIAGESAGSSSISALCTSPLAKGLFKRAIGESSSIAGNNPPHTFRSLNNALDTGKKIMEEQNCKSLSELRKVDAKKLVNTKYKNSEMTIDGYALNMMPKDAYLNHLNNEEALLNGYNLKEADAFVIPTMLFDLPNKDNIKSKLSDFFDEKAAQDFMSLFKTEIEKDPLEAFNLIISLYWFMNPHYEWSINAYNAGVKIYRYQFLKENGYYSTYHSGEMIYAYGNLDKSKHKFAYNESDYILQNKMVSYWINFIKNGDPNGTNLEKWEMWSPLNNKLISLNDNIFMFEESYLKAYKIIEDFENRKK